MEAEQTELQVLVVKLFKAKDKIKELFQSEAGKLVVEYLQILRQYNLESLAYSSFLEDNGSRVGKLQGEIRGYDEVIDCIKNLEKYELKEDKLQLKREEK
jgi:uncharacterized protein YdcH (DUF465 family)